MKTKVWKKIIAIFVVCVVLVTQGLTVQAASTENISEDEQVTTTETEAAEEASEENSEKGSEKDSEEKSYTKKDLRLMSAIIFCEAGSESYAGKKAVGIVIMNRVRSKKYPDTLKKVVYQKYQFSPVRNGSLAKALKAYDDGEFTTKNHKDCIKAAKAVLKGDTKVTYKGKKLQMKSYLFFSGYVKNHKIKIGNHMFK